MIEADTITGGEVIPGISAPVRAIFEMPADPRGAEHDTSSLSEECVATLFRVWSRDDADWAPRAFDDLRLLLSPKTACLSRRRCSRRMAAHLLYQRSSTNGGRRHFDVQSKRKVPRAGDFGSASQFDRCGRFLDAGPTTWRSMVDRRARI